MRVVNKLGLIAIVAAGLFLFGCGGSSSAKLASTPSGSFTNSVLNGTYAFSVTGTNQFGFLAIAGSFQADGNGHITAGIEDVNSGNGVFTNLPISGSYSIGADGRGAASLVSSVSVIDLDFVMISNQHGLLIRFDNNSSANGSIDLQTASAFSAAALRGTFVVNLSGIDGNGANFNLAGNFATDGVGAIPGGIVDANDNGSVSLNQAVTGIYTVGANGRGIVALNALSSTLTFAFYVVDATHWKMVETDNRPVLSGDVFLQQGASSNASLSGSFAFTVAGSSPGPFAAGGIFTADGNGNITTGAEDINNTGSLTQNLALTGNYAIVANGRGTLTLNSSFGTSNFVIYPSAGGLQMMQTDASTITSGTALPQTGAPFSNSSVQGNYGFSLGGVNSTGEIDSIAQFSANGTGGLSGAVDFNNVGALSPGLALSGTYSIAANGRGTAALKSSAGTQNLDLYMVGNGRVLAIEVDPGITAVANFEHQ